MSLTRRQNAVLIGVALLGLALRVLHLVGQTRHNPFFVVLGMDPLVHHEWAQQIATGAGMPAEPYFRAPLYSYALAGVYALLGADPLAGRLFGAALGALTCYLVGRLGAELADFRTGLLAAAIIAVYWPLLYFDVELVSVALENALAVAMLLAWLAAARRGSKALYLLGGLFWGLAAITRPTVLALAPALPVFAWLQAQPPRWRGALAACALIGVGAAAAIAPVALRNAIVGGEAVPIATNGGINFYIGNNPDSNGFSAQVPGLPQTVAGVYEATHRIAEQDVGHALSRAETSAWWFARGRAWIREDPGAFARHLWFKLRLLLAPVEIADNQPIAFFARYSSLSPLYVVGFPVLLPLAFIGCAALIGRPGARRWFLPLALCVAIAAATVLFFAPARFRAPLVPVLAVAASAGVFWLVAALAARPWADIARAAAAAAIAIAALATSPVGGSEYRRWEEAHGRYQLGWTALTDPRATAAELDAAAENLLRARELGVDDNPGRISEGLHRIGVAHLLANRPAEAISVLSRAIEIAPEQVHSLDALAAAYAAAGDPARAVEVAERGIGVARAVGNAPVEARITRRLAHYRRACAQLPDAPASCRADY